MVSWCCHSSAPSGSPRNVTVSAIVSSIVELEWLPPSAEETNGIVTGYIIHVTGQDSHEMIELQTNETGIQVDSLHPFYSYAFTVAAHTEVGAGPFSPVIYFQMPTASMSVKSVCACITSEVDYSNSAPNGFINNVTVLIDSSTSVTLSWLPINPSHWNGILLSNVVEYQRQGPTTSSNTSVESYVTLAMSIPSLPEHPLANNPDPRLVILPLREESLQINGLEEDYVYKFTVYCENTAGRSELSTPVLVTMPPSGNIDMHL